MGGHLRLSDPSVKRCDDALSLPRKFADRLMEEGEGEDLGAGLTDTGAYMFLWCVL